MVPFDAISRGSGKGTEIIYGEAKINWTAADLTLQRAYSSPLPVGVSFEYSIAGSAVDEFMAMGIGTSNEYTMEAKFLDDGGWNGTPVIPVSDNRNQDIRLVFALNSGSGGSPTGTLSVRSIQFYIPPRPQLDVVKTGNSLTAKWPLSAIDWTIETSTDLNDPNGWEPVTEPATNADFFHTMTFDVSGTNRAFFRL